ncbi:hypothetical protein FPV67DRAFT_1672904 [Lyophyllum atratum]|nr:hypothetical protein FPV67DRAFT_1672904 [Lyophyllum atratum]
MPVLVDDNFVSILCFCDIYHVLVVSQTCKRLRSLALSRHVWLAQLYDLNARLFVDVPPGQSLDALSTEELISRAKLAVQGPRSWAPHNDTPPIISHKLVLEHNCSTPDLYCENTAQLLPGGRFVLYQRRDMLECWSLSRKEILWTYKPPYPFKWLAPLIADMVDDGQAVVMLIPVQKQSETGHKDFLDVLRLDLITGMSELLVHHHVHHTDYYSPFDRCKIQGDFIVASEPPVQSSLILLRISTASYMRLKLPGNGNCCASYNGAADVALVSGHLLVAQAGCVKDGLKIHAWNLEALFDDSGTSPSQNLESTLPPPHISQTINIPISSRALVYLSTFESPIRDDSTAAWLFMTSPFLGTAQESSAISFQISHPGKTFRLPTLKSTSILNFKSRCFDQGGSSSISYAGYAEVRTTVPLGRHMMQQNGDLPGRHVIYSLREGFPRSGYLDLPDWQITPHTSAYSGALTYATDKEIVVAYYE